ncbi:MAG TPA: transcriptional repressor LexA [Thermoanaerobaculia bacterium]|nr:transcriptional repressor LexA [Thermoanaerobaculia bacterium]
MSARPAGDTDDKAVYLTERQRDILEFIEQFQGENGIAPTHREICERFGYSSYGTVYKHLKLLQDKGFLRKDWNQKRGIELLRRLPPAQVSISTQDLPFFGRIAAGQPIEALPGHETMTVPSHLLGRRRGEHYVLEVVGDSMIDEGIHEGDLVIVLQRELAQPGDMIVALVGSDATLKRFFPEGDTVRLQPANPNMKPIRVPARDVRVQGIVVGLMRRF